MPAASGSFDDADWQSIDLPHDWAVALPFVDDRDLQSKGFHPLGRKYPETSIGWYRRVFDLPAEDAGKRITLEFDGAYRESTVIFNGFYIGQHSGGYDSFSFDVSDFTNPGHPNVLLVRVDATESDGWFYEGAGIYRHVWLVKTHPVHVKRWGTFVRSEIRGNNATLSVLSEIQNDSTAASNVRVVSTIVGPSGSAVGKDITSSASIAVADQHDFRQQIAVNDAKLWSLEERNLYKLLTEVQVDGETVDRYETPFGIRSVEFTGDRGFLLNGSPVKLKGTCNHQDHAGIGVALPDAVQYYRMRKLQEMGSNSLRTSHNPPTPELLDACDQLGVLVFDETRMMSSNPEGLQQFQNLVRRDRNHPSVFMWSMGNEEGQANTPRGVLILTAMKDVATKNDGSRPVSIAPTGAIGTGGLAVGDVVGYNYQDPEAAAFHKEHPERPVMGTETVSAVGTRGIYITDKSKGFVSSYDVYNTSGRASAEGWWSFCDANPWLSGGFIWTGFDYRGEPSPNGWPNISSQYGIIDTCGFPKDSFYYYQSWWTTKPLLHLFPHWNWPGYEGKEIAVWVYSNLDKVELFVNGKSLGAQEVKKNGHVAWVATYAPGSIEARGFKDGKQVMTTRRDTTGPAAKLVLRADRESLSADGEDVAMFSVEVQDAKGRTVPITDNLVTFHVAAQPGSSASATETRRTNHPTRRPNARPSPATAWRLCRPRRPPAPSPSKPHRLVSLQARRVSKQRKWSCARKSACGSATSPRDRASLASGRPSQAQAWPRCSSARHASSHSRRKAMNSPAPSRAPAASSAAATCPRPSLMAACRAITSPSSPAGIPSKASSRAASFNSTAPCRSPSTSRSKQRRIPTRPPSARRPMDRTHPSTSADAVSPARSRWYW